MLAGRVCPFTVASCVEQTWKELYEAPPGHYEAPDSLTSKHCSLLPSVFRMDQRHGGYLFFDQRGRTYRLRDEEILLRQDAAWKISWAQHAYHTLLVRFSGFNTKYSIKCSAARSLGVLNLVGPCGLGTFPLVQFIPCICNNLLADKIIQN